MLSLLRPIRICAATHVDPENGGRSRKVERPGRRHRPRAISSPYAVCRFTAPA
jgi:hypothetical protein